MPDFFAPDGLTPDQRIEQTSMVGWKKAYCRLMVAFCRRDVDLDAPDTYAELTFEGDDETGIYADSEIGRFKVLWPWGKWGNHIFVGHPFCWNRPYNGTVAEFLTLDRAKAGCSKEYGAWMTFMEQKQEDPRLEMVRRLRDESRWGVLYCAKALDVSGWDYEKAMLSLANSTTGDLLVNSTIRKISDISNDDAITFADIDITLHL